MVDAGLGTDAGTVVSDAGRAEDASTSADAGPPPDPDAGRPDTGPPPPPACAPTAARIAVVEVMVASQSGTDRGEWFEIENIGTCTVDLAGLVIGSPTTAGEPVEHEVTAGTVGPGERFVFALSGTSSDNHGLPHDYVYGTGGFDDVFFGNTGDELTLHSPTGVLIDRIVWGDEEFLRSASRQLPTAMSPTSNDDWGAWCDSDTVFSTTGGTFYGTPGAPNDC